jgi:hypothetical protein
MARVKVGLWVILLRKPGKLVSGRMFSFFQQFTVGTSSRFVENRSTGRCAGFGVSSTVQSGEIRGLGKIDRLVSGQIL